MSEEVVESLTVWKNDLMGQQLRSAFREWSASRPRHQQTLDFRLGVSDVGSCREYARLLTIETAFTDDRSYWAADVGTAVHTLADEAITAKWPDEALVGRTVTVSMPSGLEITGHPDVLLPKTVVDFKTKDGIRSVARQGPTDQQWTQVMLYALGAVQEGYYRSDSPPRVAIAFLDRSGATDDVVVWERDYDPLVIAAADEWLSDVVYAVQNDQPASKDKPYSWCEGWCEYFSVCRGEEMAPDGGLLTDPEILSAVEMSVLGKQLAKEGKELQDEAKAALLGVSGSTGEYAVRWTHVGETELPPTFRAGYDRLNITKVKR